MRILLVEDNQAKVEKVVERLVNVSGVSRSDIDVAFTMMDARRNLKDTIYDLMILDLILPFRAGDPVNWDNSIALLTELRDRQSLKKPRQIIGLTAYEEGAKALEPIFSQQTWTVIRYRSDETAWSEQLGNAADWVVKFSSERETANFGVDVCIVTALVAPEYDAVLRNGWDWHAAEPLDDVTFVRRASFVSASMERSAISAHSPKMGMISASLLASKLIAVVRPRLMIMAGICAGVKGRTNYGDPVVADPCWDWQSGKHVVKNGESAFEIRPEQISISQEVRSRWEQLRGDRSYWSDLKANWPGHPDTDLRVRMGPSVSGSSVLANAVVLDEIKRQHGGLLSLDMESYGVMSSSTAASRPRPVTFSCKSVCDFADELKDDRWQNYAAYTSARAVAEFCERFTGQLVD